AESLRNFSLHARRRFSENIDEKGFGVVAFDDSVCEAIVESGRERTFAERGNDRGETVVGLETQQGGCERGTDIGFCIRTQQRGFKTRLKSDAFEFADEVSGEFLAGRKLAGINARQG